MNDQNELNNSEKINFKKRSKRNILNDILGVLKDSKYGLNISQIVENLSLSRNTVKSYLRILEKESLVRVSKMGRSKIYILKNASQDNVLKKFRLLISDFFKGFFDALEKVILPSYSSNLYDVFKEIGKEMSNNVIWPPLEMVKGEQVTVEQIGKIALQHLELLNEFGKVIKGEIVPAPIGNVTNSIVLRVEFIGFDFGNTDLFYYLVSGFYEKKLQDNFGDKVYLNVLKIQREIPCCYFELGIRSQGNQ